MIAFAPVFRASGSGIHLALPLAVAAIDLANHQEHQCQIDGTGIRKSNGAGRTVHKEKDMSDYNEQTLMEAVIERVAGTPDPRLRQIMISLIKHLHGFVHEVRPTSEEWLAGIQFLTAVGQKCDDKRQEFILLSDSLGVSMLVDLINHGKVGNATESDLLGPAWVEAAPELPLGSNVAKHPSEGEPCVITGSVANLDGTPLAGAVVDFWEADGDGLYDLQKPNGLDLRARLRTDASGQFWFRAVRPVNMGYQPTGQWAPCWRPPSGITCAPRICIS